MKQKVLQYALITLVALFVWLYAEGATRRLRDVNVTVKFIPPPGQKLLINPETRSVTLTVRAATAQLEELNSLREQPLELEVVANPGEPEQSLRLDARMQRLERVARMGVTIERVEPDVVTVRVEELAQVALPIRLITPPEVELAGPPVFTTVEGGRSVDQVTVTVPVSNASAAQRQTLLARLDAAALAGVVPGVTQERTVDLAVPTEMSNWPYVALEPRRVKVSFTVKKKEDELKIGIVPVFLYIQPHQARQYAVEVEQESQVLLDVEIKGPSDVIARIREGAGPKIEAMLRLEPVDLENLIEAKIPELRLPAGVTVESTLPAVKMKITRRN